MEKVFKVEGMMCANCEKHVKNALEAIGGVTEAIPNHMAENVIVKMADNIPDEILKAAVSKAGYKAVFFSRCLPCKG